VSDEAARRAQAENEAAERTQTEDGVAGDPA
jgi:hypothetical protein